MKKCSFLWETLRAFACFLVFTHPELLVAYLRLIQDLGEGVVGSCSCKPVAGSRLL